MFTRLHNKQEVTHIRQVANSIQFMLKESPAESLKIAKKWKSLRLQSDLEWQWIIDHEPGEIAKKMQEIEIENEDEEALTNCLNSTDSGIILATLHMGNYLLSGLRLLKPIRGKKVIIPRRKVNNFNRVFSKLSAFNIEYEVVPNTPRSAQYLLRCLRKGNIVILPFDLSQKWGKTVTVEVMGRNLNWVMGPALLAFLSQAVVVPFYTTIRGHGCKCHIDQVLDLSLTYYQLNTYLALAQYLASIGADLIRTYPEQWHHWNLIPEMLSIEYGLK